MGTSSYPGMQFTSVFIYRALNYVGVKMSLNDVCVFVPVWFGVIATVLLGLVTHECFNSVVAGVAASAIFAVVPAHIMRSVGGGYDNESVAMTAMLLTFYLWVRSLRSKSSWPIGALAGLGYFNMVAAWGGYVFVLNMVGIHALALILLGRFTPKLHRSYSLFFVIGTIGALQIPVVGLAPLKSLEQLGPAGVFVLMQVLAAIPAVARSGVLGTTDRTQTTIRVFGIAAAAGAAVVAALAPTGYFGPLSSRVRSLFVQHTRTGNPLVDSVAEHQPASADAYWHYLHYTCLVAPLGFVATLYRPSDARVFLFLFAVVAYYFSNRMSRLIILIGPVASALAGYAVGEGMEWAVVQTAILTSSTPDKAAAAGADADEDTPSSDTPSKQGKSSKGGKPKSKSKKGKPSKAAPEPFSAEWLWDKMGLEALQEWSLTSTGKAVRLAIAAAIVLAVSFGGQGFFRYSHAVAQGMSHPQIMYQARLQDGTMVMVDDYRQAYFWLRDNTPEDSRVMAWWDYGYQISAIANRTTIADGNTWNHEHIALLGRCLTSPEKQAHRMIRHLADYVLVWAGGGGDDLAKSPHMARIGTSVFSDICPNDPMCQQYGFDAQRRPSPMMERSLLYKLHGHGVLPGVTLSDDRFREVFSSKYGKVRIYKVQSVSQKSKDWAASPTNWKCDAPGSWYCVGQYPPALSKVLAKSKAFAQFEDFNRKD